MKGRVYNILSNVLGIPIETIYDDSSPDNIESWDSLKHIDLIMSLEEEFDVTIDDEKLLEMMNARLILLTLEEIMTNQTN